MFVPALRQPAPVVWTGHPTGKAGGGLSEAIAFPATVYKVQTLADHGIRIYLDLPESAIPQMAMLADCQRQGIPLSFVASLTIFDDETEKRAKKRNSKVGRRRS